MLTVHPAFTGSYFNLCDPFISTAFCVCRLCFYFESLWHVVPKQPPSHVHKHMHHPHVRHLPARWRWKPLVSEPADMICQVLAVGTWDSCKHRHDLSAGGPVRVAVCTACVHAATICIHTVKVYLQELYTHTHTPAAGLCEPECQPDCGPVKRPIEIKHSRRCSGSPSTKTHKDAHTHVTHESFFPCGPGPLGFEVVSLWSHERPWLI